MSIQSQDAGRRAQQLSPEELSRLVMQRRRQRAQQPGAAAPAGEALVRRGAGTAPLSFAQLRLWLLDRIEPGGTAYSMPAVSRLLGDLRPAMLARSLAEIGRRHEALRTRFTLRDGEPLQVIDAAAALPLPLLDLAQLPPAARRAEADRLIAADAARPFDLERGPLARAALVRLHTAEHLLLFNMHHVISDGWSFSLLYRELSELYAAFSAGQPSPLAELPMQYADFAVWQRDFLRGGAADEQLAYWAERLRGAPPFLDLPTDRPRPPAPSHRGGVVGLHLDARLTAALVALSRARSATLFMTLLAAFKVLLGRWSGQDDVVVGAPSAGRQRVECEPLIGCFLNTLVLRTDLSGNPPFLDLLARVRETVLGAYRCQDVPFERLLDELQVERQLSRTPLFQVFFNMITVPEIRLDLSGLRMEPLQTERPLAKFDFTLYVEERGGTIQGNLVYSADLFDRARMQALVAQLGHLLEQAAAAPETPVAALSLRPTETAHLLPDPALPLPDAAWPGPVHARLSEQAARRPQQLLAEDDRDRWTYAQMEARANQLAHRLRRAGVGGEDVVAIYAHRNISLVWAVLGTLKAGAAFLILDPAYPAARLASYLEIARPAAWLAVEGAGTPPPAVAAALAGVAPRLVITLPRVAADGAAAALAEFAAFPAKPPAVAASALDLACVAFTSGSTGTPKAVLGRHGSLSQFLPWWCRTFQLGEHDCFAMLSALAHDPLQRDILTPIWVGARLAIPDPEMQGEPGWLAAWAARMAVTVVGLTPAKLEQLVGDAGTPCLPALRRAFVVGDLLRRDEVARLQRIAPALVCVNLYGATETQRAISYTVVPRQTESPAAAAGLGPQTLPLGRGIPGVELLVLGAGGALAGIGELGEIHIRSRYLARGYLGDAPLTAQRFLSNPFRAAASATGATGATGETGETGETDAEDRLYRTGDLGRYGPGGAVEYAGRADQQVKIRGFRVEPGEIEAVLRQHQAVGACVVVARSAAAGMRLAAYLAPAAAAVPARELRELVAARLPDYMVPARFVWLDALPMTHTGKVDRRALPEADELPDTGTPTAPAPPRSPTEELVAGIWQELLGAAHPPGIHDNFFDLGGHSLLATRALSRLRSALGVELPLRTLFEAPTVAGLAAAALRRRDDRLPAAPPLGPRARPDELPLSFGQQRLWVLEQLEPGTAAHNLATALHFAGPLDGAALARAIGHIVARHQALRTVFPARDGMPRQHILPAAGRPLPRVDLRTLPAARRDPEALRLAAADALLPFDLEGGPRVEASAGPPWPAGLLRATLLIAAPDQHDLLLCMHHMVTDGWSLAIFTRELTALYTAFAAGVASPLAPLPLQYADFALWQRDWLRGPVLDEQLGYWRSALAGAPPRLGLTTDRPRPPVPSHRGGRCWATLPPDAAQRIAAQSRHLDVTPFMALLAAFAALLARHTGDQDLVVGTPIANRGRPELEELIGFFANTLALRVDAAGDPTFADLARRVRQTALGAYAHQDLPFERLVDELAPERDLAASPIFQVMFILHNAPPAALSLAELTCTPREVDAGKAPFDLTLSLVESAGQLLARLEFAGDLFERATAARLLGHFTHLAAAAAAQPETRLGDLPLLAEAERGQLLAAAAGPALMLPDGRTVDQLIAATARRTPRAVAVSCGGRRLLYGELLDRATGLAARLAEHGVGPEVRVALCVERTPDMVVAMLAVLLAGGAYVPLDPAHPAERLGWILADSGAAVLLADRRARQALPQLPQLVIDPASAETADAAGAAPASPASPAAPPATGARQVAPQNLAYLIYTSGSTGRPKGVAVTHRSIVNYLAAMTLRPGLTPGDTVLALTTLSFDIAVTELLLPLTVGARIELVDRDTAADPERLGARLEAADVTFMQATPTTWTLLLDGGWGGRPGLVALAGGEALPAPLAARLRQRVGTLWNVYGPTETTVWSTLAPVEPGAAQVTIGGPLANTTTDVLDRCGQLAPAGAPGELCIGGLGLARGYAGLPALTAARFVPDPFAAQRGAGGRLYRTGDLVRRLPGGALEFLGRIDSQVKVRGVRIELGEVEAALAGLAGVAQAAVVVRERAAGERFLAAFVVPAPTAPRAAPRATPATVARVATWRDELRLRLPDAMVPSVFVPLASLPLSPSGKLDRQALARLDLPAGDPAGGGGGGAADGTPGPAAAPRDAAEELLAAVWAEVLGRAAVGIHDNFFALGGDSILAIRVVARARRGGLRFTPRDLFQHQTVAALAAAAGADAVLGTAVSAAGKAGGHDTGAAAVSPSRAGGAAIPTPADFPAAGLTQEGLDELLAELAID